MSTWLRGPAGTPSAQRTRPGCTPPTFFAGLTGFSSGGSPTAPHGLKVSLEPTRHVKNFDASQDRSKGNAPFSRRVLRYLDNIRACARRSKRCELTARTNPQGGAERFHQAGIEKLLGVYSERKRMQCKARGAPSCAHDERRARQQRADCGSWKSQ